MKASKPTFILPFSHWSTHTHTYARHSHSNESQYEANLVCIHIFLNQLNWNNWNETNGLILSQWEIFVRKVNTKHQHLKITTSRCIVCVWFLEANEHICMLYALPFLRFVGIANKPSTENDKKSNTNISMLRSNIFRQKWFPFLPFPFYSISSSWLGCLFPFFS